MSPMKQKIIDYFCHCSVALAIFSMTKNSKKNFELHWQCDRQNQIVTEFVIINLWLEYFFSFPIFVFSFVCLVSGNKWKARFKIRCLGLCDIDWCKVYWNIVSSKCKYYIIHIQYSIYGFCVLSAFEWQIKGWPALIQKNLCFKFRPFPGVKLDAS